MEASPLGPVRVLVSACLLGEEVRYDGKHTYDAFLVEQLGRHVVWEGICPERDSGMPIPRPPMRLIGEAAAPRLISRTGADLTEQMQRFIERKLAALEAIELCGYVCKSNSPSSGMTQVHIYDEQGRAAGTGSGLFTAAFLRRFPLIPVEEEGRLRDARLREAFIERLFCRRRWLDLMASGPDRGTLVEFHTEHKFLLLSHGRRGYTELGRLVAAAKDYEPQTLFATYEKMFMATLAQPSTVKKVLDVLQHLLGFFKEQLSGDEKRELLETFETYRRSQVPLIVPLTLIQQYVRKYEVTYLARQVYLSPYPADLMLRNSL
ncbi:MAG: hypothetical protein A2284_06615 [Deltaproteobacteria bacterium RIFOXYA12_FULL_61_11]|nr:MAG: hypothetical protein A2284_06615 [Deltaproteobacteria bacterium RIFOXYA12_FULL_61_11]